MGRTVDYYLAPQSPWAYLGHQRFADIAQRTGASIRVMPIDLGGKVFPISGGLPLGQRAPQRQAYRLVELQRFSEHLGAPLNLKPRYFPVSGDDAARLIIAADLAQGPGAAMRVAGVVLVRQRPGSAKGVVFLTLEDEFSVCNAVIWPQVLETHRAVVMGARLMLIRGRVQRTGDIIHVVAGTIETSLSPVTTEVALSRCGICTIFVPVMSSSISITTWLPAPSPADPKWSLPGSARAIASSDLRSLAGKLLRASKT